jgi:predicted ATPase
LDSFVGRERELRELAKPVQTMPLVTLVGEGGVGKTRLAHEVARRQLSSQAGTFLVELAGLDDSALLVGAFAAAVGGPDTRVESSIGGLTQYLQPTRLLLVFDNCEHLVQACAELVAHLLHRCPELRVLATSREPMAIAGEVIWWLPQLECPDAGAITVEQLTRTPAAQLFVERARAIIPELRITDATAAAIARICRAVDGSPLALELAAARTRALGLEELATRVERDPQILSRRVHGARRQHQTIRATIDWSYDRLGEPERTLLRQVAEFDGAWSLEMAELGCAGSGLACEQVLDVLGQLVEKSLVVADTSGARACYRLSSSVRRYVLERGKALVPDHHVRSAAGGDHAAARHDCRHAPPGLRASRWR